MTKDEIIDIDPRLLEAVDSHNKKYDTDAIFEGIMQIKPVVNKAIEALRIDKKIGGSLDCSVILYLAEKWYKLLAPLQIVDELKHSLIVSYCRIRPLSDKISEAKETEIEGVFIDVRPCEHPKCERCWRRESTVGCNKYHPTICLRCSNNLFCSENDVSPEFRYFV